MKKLFIALAVMSSVSAFATCPKLSGEYVQCTSTSNLPDFKTDYMRIEDPKVENGSYTLVELGENSSSMEVTPDNTPRTTTETDPDLGEYEVKVTAYCKDNSLVMDAEVMMFSASTVISKPTEDTLQIVNRFEDEVVNTTTCKKANL